MSFPCFSKYFESFLDVRTYSIVFPRKIVVPRVIPFPRVIDSPSLLVKKKIDTIYSFLLHPFTLAHSTPGSVCQKKKKKSRLSLPTQTPGRWCSSWIRSRLTDLWALWINSKKPNWAGAVVFCSSKRQNKKNETARFLIWHRLECACSVYLMSLSHEERLPTRKI